MLTIGQETIMKSHYRVYRPLFIFTGLVLLALLTNCTRRKPSSYDITYSELIQQLTNTLDMANLSEPGVEILTSYDRSGGNDDFNHPVRETGDGWAVLADLDGPGCITRFWFTGGRDHNRIKIFIDGEKRPRIDKTIGAFCGGEKSYLPPIAAREPYCWFNFMPISFQDHIKIMVEKRNDTPNPKMYYQIAYKMFKPDQAVEPFPVPFSSAQKKSLAAARAFWQEKREDLSHLERSVYSSHIQAGKSTNSAIIEGPAVIRELSVSLDEGNISPLQKNALLRDIVINVYWDGSNEPSVSAPIGDFFGSGWKTIRYQSTYFGALENLFYNRFPMPFKEQCRVEFINESDTDIAITLGLRTDRYPDNKSIFGYLHTSWNKSNPEEVGSPHPVVHAKGKGKYVGCILNTLSRDQSWWLLEADEYMYIDDDTFPRWHGTGLEDYFNAGWYYGNALAQAFHGIIFKAPFRTIQYNIHQTDPVQFNKRFLMEWERGPANESHGLMESTAFYYMGVPSGSGSDLLSKDARRAPSDEAEIVTLMSEINNYERLGDYRGAHDAISAFIQKHPGYPLKSIVEARQMLYEAEAGSRDTIIEDLSALKENPDYKLAHQQIADWLWIQENAGNGLLGIYCNARSRVFVNGNPVTEIADPNRMRFYRVDLNEGRNCIAVQSAQQAYPDWVQVCLLTSQTNMYSDADWAYGINAQGQWAEVGFDDSAWPVIGKPTMKGPPEVPYIRLDPNIYPDAQSKAKGMRPDWKGQKGYVVYRKEFTLP